MGAIARFQRTDQFACPVDETFDAIAVVDVTGNDDVEIVTEGDEATVKHPVGRA